MSSALLLVAMSFLATPDFCEQDALNYDNLVYVAMKNCKNAKPENIDPELLWSLVEVERKYDVPYELRGMILAAACMESGYNPEAKGDRKFSKSKKKPMAIR